MIPSVKQWKVTTTTGATYIVLAPTRTLARLNFRHYIGWQDVRSIGLVRRKRIRPDGTVAMAWRES